MIKSIKSIKSNPVGAAGSRDVQSSEPSALRSSLEGSLGFIDTRHAAANRRGSMDFIWDIAKEGDLLTEEILGQIVHHVTVKGIDAGMRRIGVAISKKLRGARVAPRVLKPENIAPKLDVELEGARIKIEVTPVSRGCVFEPVTMSVSGTVEESFGFAETQVVSFPDLYAGKMVAALDRQHPRDLFDVRELLAKEGLSDELRSAFVAYMLSHNRPMAEVLAPRLKDLALEFDRGFVGMTAEPVALEELAEARNALIADAVGNMPDAHRRFLVGFKRGEPDWDLLGLPHVADLPAVKWRQQNYDKLGKDERAAEVGKLEKVLFPNGQSG